MFLAFGRSDAMGRRLGALVARGFALIRFLSSVLLTLLGLTVITFVIGRLIPIDPALAIVGDHASTAAYEATRAKLGLDLPFIVQYWRYLLGLLQGDFGTSVITGQPVLDDVLSVFPATIELSTLALLIGVGVGVPLGVAAAVRRGRWSDHLIRLVALFGYSVPIFWLGLVGLLVFYSKLGWLSGPGRVDVAFADVVPPVTGLILVDSLLSGNYDVFSNALSHIILPAALLGYMSLAYVARMTRSFMLGQLSQEYILTARAKGLSGRKVVWVHAFGNILVPLVTVVALSYGSLLEGAVLTETVFAWPGLGLYMKNSLFNSDMNAVLGGTLVIGVVYIGFSLLSDLAYPLLDPRARNSGSRGH
jgi:peptide/nickel transport system permease protein